MITIILLCIGIISIIIGIDIPKLLDKEINFGKPKRKVTYHHVHGYLDLPCPSNVSSPIDIYLKPYPDVVYDLEYDDKTINKIYKFLSSGSDFYYFQQDYGLIIVYKDDINDYVLINLTMNLHDFSFKYYIVNNFNMYKINTFLGKGQEYFNYFVENHKDFYDLLCKMYNTMLKIQK